jgi:hypothetical protein
MWWNEGPLGWSGDTRPLCDWCDYVIQERPQTLLIWRVTLSIARYHMCSVSLPRTSVNSHIFPDFDLYEVSLLHSIFHMPVINLMFQTYTAKNIKITVFSDLTSCNMIPVRHNKRHYISEDCNTCTNPSVNRLLCLLTIYLPLSNLIFLPPAFSPALIYFGRERG